MFWKWDCDARHVFHVTKIRAYFLQTFLRAFHPPFLRLVLRECRFHQPGTAARERGTARKRERARNNSVHENEEERGRRGELCFPVLPAIEHSFRPSYALHSFLSPKDFVRAKERKRQTDAFLAAALFSVVSPFPFLRTEQR